MDNDPTTSAAAAIDTLDDCYNFSPIGHLQTVFLHKNGTPRQPTVCQSSRASLTVSKSVFNNPDHSLQGLQEYSHIWLVFVFHLNNNACTKAKVKPPRLNGAKLGLFATRSPYRPAPIGLTLAKIESIQGATLYLSGVDIVSGTPILDIKPYIPGYDRPLHSSVTDSQPAAALDTDNVTAVTADPGTAHAATWLQDTKSDITEVIFTGRAVQQLHKFKPNEESEYGLSFLQSTDEAKQSITEILMADPRSAYRRKNCCDRLYYFTVDNMHVTCWFDDSVVEVVKVQPVAAAPQLNSVSS